MPISLGIPSKDGYAFEGWYLNGEKVTSIAEGTKGDLHLVAKWELADYTIHYELNGGVNHLNNKNGYTIDNLPLTLYQPTKDGYNFTGWYLNDKLVEYLPENTLGEITLVATWELANYNLSYNLDGGILESENPSTYNINDEFTLNIPTKEGYNFLGWYLNDVRVEKIEKGTTGNLLLVARWRTYLISEVKEVDKETIVATIGIITSISSNNNGFSILIQDDTDAIMVYKIDSSKFNYSEFCVGQEVTILGEYTLFNGLSEIQNIEQIEFGELKEIPDVTELESLPNEQILQSMQSKIIKIKLKYLNGTVGSKSNATFIDSLGNQIVVRGDNTWGNIDSIVLKENQEVIVTGFINWYNGVQITNVSNYQFIEQKDEDIANAVLDSLNVPTSITQTTDLDIIEGLTWELVTANENVKVENNQIIVLSNDEEISITIIAKYLYKNIEYTKSFDIKIEQATSMLFNNGDKVIILTRRNSGNYFIMNSDLGSASTKRLQAIDTGTSILGDVINQEENQVWTVEISGSNYYLKSFDGKYITWISGNSSSLSDEKYALNITFDGEFYEISSVSDSTRKLQLNNTSGNNYFAFYTNNQAGDLIIQKAQELTDEERVDIFLNNLEVETSVSDDFSLPESEGLTWSLKDGTSNYAILSGSTVTITRPAIGESDVIVIFIASYTVNAITKTKEFDITILANTGEPQKEWKLVTDVSNLSIGDQIIIVASNYDYALSVTQSSNNRTGISITKQNNIVIINDSTQILTLTAGTNANQFGFYTGTGYLYAASSSKNYLRTTDALDDNGSWSISITTDGIATIKSNGTYTRNWIRYNTSSKLFACYSNGQNDVSIYKLS
ncbi:MAG: InlB B-repeat-containing protein [Staphylococcus sp.]|nr:InlB B-repeat-containing protein [Staphylococcus sp.]